MIDVPQQLLNHLRNQPPVVAEFGSRIYAESAYPEAGYAPAQGACLAFRVRGGQYRQPPERTTHKPSVQFKIYPAALQVAAQEADRLWRVLDDALTNAPCGCIWYAVLDAAPTTQREQGSTPEWIYKLAFYTIGILDGAGATPCQC